MSNKLNYEIRVSMILNLIDEVDREVKKAQETIDRGDPSYAVSWYGDSLAIASTVAGLKKSILKMTEEGKDAEFIVAAVVTEALSGVLSRSTMNSTSMCSNTAGIAEIQFWQKLLSRTGYSANAFSRVMFPGVLEGSAE